MLIGQVRSPGEMTIPTLTLAVTYRVEAPLEFAAYPGPSWRGRLGKALQDIVCQASGRTCTKCFVRATCLYALLFEDLTAPNSGKPSPPRPFVLHMDWANWSRSCVPGDVLGFSFTLFGESLRKRLPIILSALERMGRGGFGSLHRMALIAVDVIQPDGEHQERLLAGHFPSALPEPHPWPACSLSTQTSRYDVEIELLTPLQLIVKGRHLDRCLPFHELIRALLRRRHYLLENHGNRAFLAPEQLEREEKKLPELAETVKTQESDLRWQDFRRVSKRRGKHQSLSGLLGTIRYSGVPGSLVELLHFGVLCHAGKSTTMGLGAYALGVHGHRWQPPFWDSEEVLQP